VLAVGAGSVNRALGELAHLLGTRQPMPSSSNAAG
jgi:hypothetical protein